MSIKVTAACPVCGQSVSYQHEESEAWGAISLTDFGIVEITAHDKGRVVHPHMTGHIEDGSWAEALKRRADQMTERVRRQNEWGH